MKCLEQIGYWMNVLIIVGSAMYVYLRIFDCLFTMLTKHCRFLYYLADFFIHYKEFHQWLFGRLGPICDACGKPITEDQENIGHECDLHRGCADE